MVSFQTNENTRTTRFYPCTLGVSQAILDIFFRFGCEAVTEPFLSNEAFELMLRNLHVGGLAIFPGCCSHINSSSFQSTNIRAYADDKRNCRRVDMKPVLLAEFPGCILLPAPSTIDDNRGKRLQSFRMITRIDETI